MEQTNYKQKIWVAFCIILALSLLINALFIGYKQQKEDEGKLIIVATFYPLAYFAKEIGGVHVVVRTLVPGSGEVHAWDPLPSDILEADSADILLYNGVQIDSWFTDDILHAIETKDKTIVETTKDLKLEEENEENDTAGNGASDGHEHGLFDPHTWISPYLAVRQAESIYTALVQKDPSNEGDYTRNWNALKDVLEDLDNEYRVVLANKTRDTIFVNHAAFGYLAERYDFEQQGVIGLSADEQPSTATIVGLIDQMVENDINVIYVDPVYPDEFADTIKEEVKEKSGRSVKILELYLLINEIDGKDYLEQQRANLENLRIGLEVT